MSGNSHVWTVTDTCTCIAATATAYARLAGVAKVLSYVDFIGR